MSSKEKNRVLAEELGHHFTTVGNILEQSNIGEMKQEVRARRWGYEKIASLDLIVEAFQNGFRSKYDLSEHLNITDKYLEQAIEYYRAKYGLYVEHKNHLIYFEPFGILYLYSENQQEGR